MGIVTYSAFAYLMTAVISYLMMGVIVAIYRLTGSEKEKEKKGGM